MTDDPLIQLVVQGVFSAVFLLLYFDERRARLRELELERQRHEETRKTLFEVLREVAGLRPTLSRNREDTTGHGL